MGVRLCRRSGWWRLLPRGFLFALVLVLALGMSFGVQAQEQPSTTTGTTPQWVLLEKARWDTLTTLALTLDQRLTARSIQGEKLAKQLSESEQNIESLETSVAKLQTDLLEIQRLRDNLQTSLEMERTVWSTERLDILKQRDLAREQRNKEAERAGQLEISNRRNGMVWKIGIPIATVLGILIGMQM